MNVPLARATLLLREFGLRRGLSDRHYVEDLGTCRLDILPRLGTCHKSEWSTSETLVVSTKVWTPITARYSVCVLTLVVG